MPVYKHGKVIPLRALHAFEPAEFTMQRVINGVLTAIQVDVFMIKLTADGSKISIDDYAPTTDPNAVTGSGEVTFYTCRYRDPVSQKLIKLDKAPSFKDRPRGCDLFCNGPDWTRMQQLLGYRPKQENSFPLPGTVYAKAILREGARGNYWEEFGGPELLTATKRLLSQMDEGEEEGTTETAAAGSAVSRMDEDEAPPAPPEPAQPAASAEAPIDPAASKKKGR